MFFTELSYFATDISRKNNIQTHLIYIFQYFISYILFNLIPYLVINVTRLLHTISSWSLPVLTSLYRLQSVCQYRTSALRRCVTRISPLWLLTMGLECVKLVLLEMMPHEQCSRLLLDAQDIR